MKITRREKANMLEMQSYAEKIAKEKNIKVIFKTYLEHISNYIDMDEDILIIRLTGHDTTKAMDLYFERWAHLQECYKNERLQKLN